MTDKAKPAAKPVPTEIKEEPPVVFYSAPEETIKHNDDTDISHALHNFDQPRLLGTSNAKPSVAKVVNGEVYIASVDAAGNPVLIIQSLEFFLSAYGAA
jgi:hypothetical protein